MNTGFRCDDKETLIAYLYDEIDPQLQRDLTTHLRACAACAREVEALRHVRRDLSAWQPPEAELEFSIVPKGAAVLRPHRWSAAAAPVWLQMAAAVLVLAAGAAIANVQVRYDGDGLTVSTGWVTRPAPATVPGAAPTPEPWRPALAALESDLRRELQLVKTTASSTSRAAVAAPDADALYRRVQALVAESERRQQRELAVRMAQFGRDVQSDLYRINLGFRQLQGRTGVVEGNQRELVNFVNQVRRVSTQQVP